MDAQDSIQSTDWGDIKLCDLGSDDDDKVDIVAKVRGLEQAEQDFNTELLGIGIRGFRMPCDITELYADNKEPSVSTSYVVLRKKALGDADKSVIFEAQAVSIQTLIPGDVKMDDDGVLEIACMDMAPRGWQSRAGNELECHALRESMRQAFPAYASRGVAHPSVNVGQDPTEFNWQRIIVIDYDSKEARMYDDKGGRRWGRPIGNAEFAASGGVEKLVITIYNQGKDAAKLWKQPGELSDGVDHILFRNPADIFGSFR